MEEESKTKFSMNVEFSFAFKIHRKSLKTTIDKSKRRGYDCVTRLRTFLKFTGISSQDQKRVLQQKKGGAQRLWVRCTICCMIKIKMRQMKK